MSDWRPSFLAAIVVLCGGGLVGALGGDDSRKPASTVTQRVTVTTPGTVAATPRSSSAPSTAGNPVDIPITPPADEGAPDTLIELNEAGQIYDEFDSATFGTIVIADKTYDGVSLPIGRNGLNGAPGGLPISIKGRYRSLSGVVGIDSETSCPENDASVSITDNRGQTLWGPQRVSVSSARRFDIPIKKLSSVNLVGRSLALAGDRCPEGEDYQADMAWGRVLFAK